MLNQNTFVGAGFLRRRGTVWVSFFLFWLALGVFSAGFSSGLFLVELPRLRRIASPQGWFSPTWRAFLYQLATWLAWAALAPVALWLRRRWPLERGALKRALPAHVVAVVLLCAAHSGVVLLAIETQILRALVVVCLLTFSPPIRARQTEASFSTAPQRPRPWDKVKEVAVGAAAPDWRLKTVEGETATLSGLRGKVVVLDFWANWRRPCRTLEPLFDQLALEYQSKPVKFFTISVWPDQGFAPRAYLKDRRTATAFLIGDDLVAKDYGIWGLPTYFVIDPAGKVSYIHVLLSVDPEPLEKRLREAIERVLPKEQDDQSFAKNSSWRGTRLCECSARTSDCARCSKTIRGSPPRCRRRPASCPITLKSARPWGPA